MIPGRYRKKPIEVEAVLVTAENLYEVAQWVRSNGGATAGLLVRAMGPIEQRCIEIGTLEGVMTARVGNYVVRGAIGEFYPCRGDVFEGTYEPIDAGELYFSGEGGIPASAGLE